MVAISYELPRRSETQNANGDGSPDWRETSTFDQQQNLDQAESRAVSTVPARNASRKRDFHPHHKIDPTHARDGLNRMFSNNGEFTKSAA
jgi:hypothetical protein